MGNKKMLLQASAFLDDGRNRSTGLLRAGLFTALPRFYGRS